MEIISCRWECLVLCPYNYNKHTWKDLRHLSLQHSCIIKFNLYDTRESSEKIFSSFKSDKVSYKAPIGVWIYYLLKILELVKFPISILHFASSSISKHGAFYQAYPPSNLPSTIMYMSSSSAKSYWGKGQCDKNSEFPGNT